MTEWVATLVHSSEPTARLARALGPAALILTYVVAGAIAYALRTRFGRRFRDEEMDQRGIGGLTTPGLRHFFAWLMRPFWRGAVAADIPPNAITTLSLGLSLGAGFAVATGQLALGGWLFLVGGALDFVDGRVARVTGRVTKSGAALDSVLDRYAEAALLLGLAWYYRSTWVLAVVLLAIVGSQMVPYVRARGEALGATLKDVGPMQRPERIVVLGLGSALSPALEAVLEAGEGHPPHRLTIAALVLVAVGAHITAVVRLVALLTTLGRPAPQLRAAYLRAGAVSLVAMVTDFAIAQLAFSQSSAPVIATLVGCVAGGAVVWVVARGWAPDSRPDPVMHRSRRFGVAWAGTTLLSATGVWLALRTPGAGFTVAWVATRVVVFMTWNYPLMRDCVSRVSASPTASPLEARATGGSRG